MPEYKLYCYVWLRAPLESQVMYNDTSFEIQDTRFLIYFVYKPVYSELNLKNLLRGWDFGSSRVDSLPPSLDFPQV